MSDVKKEASRIVAILGEFENECVMQDVEWGQQDHPPFRGETDRRRYENQARYYKQINDARQAAGENCWDTILLEEVFEALAEYDPSQMRGELVQVGAVAANFIASLDRLIEDDPEPVEAAVEIDLPTAA